MTLPCVWDGDAFVPRRGYRKLADRDFVVGVSYVIEVSEPRSAASHKQYFAAVADAWSNLPERLAEAYPSPEHLRKHALIRVGFCNTQAIVCASAAEARRVAAFVRPLDTYAVVTVNRAVVTVSRAKSQNTRAMDKATFQASKVAVLAWLDDLLGTEPGTVEREAGRAA